MYLFVLGNTISLQRFDKSYSICLLIVEVVTSCFCNAPSITVNKTCICT